MVSQDKFSKQDADQSKEANINAEQFGKIPIDRIHQQRVTTQCCASQLDPNNTARPEASATTRSPLTSNIAAAVKISQAASFMRWLPAPVLVALLLQLRWPTEACSRLSPRF
jgi:hypothetical protein